MRGCRDRFFDRGLAFYFPDADLVGFRRRKGGSCGRIFNFGLPGFADVWAPEAFPLGCAGAFFSVRRRREAVLLALEFIGEAILFARFSPRRALKQARRGFE
jgi:hypothetical protein